MRFIVLFFCMLLTLSAQGFEHPKRFEALKEELVKEGLDRVYLERLFSSTKAHWRDKKSFKLIADRKAIKKHRKAEQEANKKFLLKKALLKQHLKKYKKIYDAVEERYGVNREIIAAILQKETALGAFKSYKYDAFSVLCAMLDRLNLSIHPKPWQRKRFNRLKDFAYKNLKALILYAHKKGINLLKTSMPSSYAGAVGIAQFTPQHFDLIVTAPGDKNASLHHMPTAIFSTANLLVKRFGWKEAVDFKKLKNLPKVIRAWYRFDKGDANFVYEKNLDGMRVPNFVKSYDKNESIVYTAKFVKVLKRYNFSTAYALGILQIALAAHEC